MMYVDGYNFYYAIKQHPNHTPIHLAWCDFSTLARKFLLEEGDALAGIRYFTAPVGSFGNAGGEAGGEQKRQAIWLAALRNVPGLDIIEGVHTGEAGVPRSRKEKETDVNIAIRAVIDGAQGRYDRAILLTGDRDQRPTVSAITGELGKHVDVWLAPGQELGFWNVMKALPRVRVRKVTAAMLAKSRLPEKVTIDGLPVDVPRSWRAPNR